MKKVVTISVVILFIGCLLHAQQALAKVSETQTFKGLLESVEYPKDLKKGNVAELTAIDPKGNKTLFVVRTGIGVTISGRDSLATLKELNAGDNVIIEYTTAKEGVNKVTAIECRKARNK